MVYSPTQQTQLVDYEEKLVTRVINKVIVKEQSFEVKLKSGDNIC